MRNFKKLLYFSLFIDLGNQPNGIYLYRVIDESGALVGEGKFVIEK